MQYRANTEVLSTISASAFYCSCKKLHSVPTSFFVALLQSNKSKPRRTMKQGHV